jgi:DNA-binding XRE family transcriptional regulator
MRSSIVDVLPSKVRRSLKKFGADLGIARRKRGLTAAMMAERLAVADTTYLRAEKGDPKVSMGVYAMAMYVLGFGEVLAEIADPRRDDQGLLLDVERLPKRVRTKKEPTPS